MGQLQRRNLRPGGGNTHSTQVRRRADRWLRCAGWYALLDREMVLRDELGKSGLRVYSARAERAGHRELCRVPYGLRLIRTEARSFEPPCLIPHSDKFPESHFIASQRKRLTSIEVPYAQLIQKTFHTRCNQFCAISMLEAPLQRALPVYQVDVGGVVDMIS